MKWEWNENELLNYSAIYIGQTEYLVDVPSLSGGSPHTPSFYRVLKSILYQEHIIYLQLTTFSSRPSYIPPPYSSGPMMLDSLIADLLCVWLFSIYTTPVSSIYHSISQDKRNTSYRGSSLEASTFLPVKLVLVVLTWRMVPTDSEVWDSGPFIWHISICWTRGTK